MPYGVRHFFQPCHGLALVFVARRGLPLVGVQLVEGPLRGWQWFAKPWQALQSLAHLLHLAPPGTTIFSTAVRSVASSWCVYPACTESSVWPVILLRVSACTPAAAIKLVAV